MRKTKYYSALTLLALLPMLAACKPQCPSKFSELSARYATDAFRGVDTITLLATFTNNSGDDMIFDGSETFQLWVEVGGTTEHPPVIVHIEPSGAVADGAEFTYKLAIDVAAYANKKAVIGFRGVCPGIGTMAPDMMPLVMDAFTCN